MNNGQTAHEALFLGGIPAVQDRWVRSGWTVHGPGEAAYTDFRNDMAAYDIISYAEPVTKTVNPALIEGMVWHPDELRRPDRFWSQHKRGGTEQSVREIADRIPAVKAALDAGANLEDLARDPELGPCTEIYFATDRPDALILLEAENFYFFQGNGRHRAIAARLAGQEIPARIIGRIVPAEK